MQSTNQTNITPAIFANYAIALHAAKNKDYGNSFDKTVDKYGYATCCIRLDDKIGRIQSLQKKSAEVVDESMFDTWLDMFNYALMSAAYMKGTIVDDVADTTKIFDMLCMDMLTDELELFDDDNTIERCAELNDIIWEAWNDMQPDALRRMISACQHMARIAFNNCLTFDMSHLKPKYLKQ